MNIGSIRDHVGWALANAALRIATHEYRRTIHGSITYGMRSAARDVREGRTPPLPVLAIEKRQEDA